LEPEITRFRASLAPVGWRRCSDLAAHHPPPLQACPGDLSAVALTKEEDRGDRQQGGNRRNAGNAEAFLLSGHAADRQ
jgi:hypothetical protein